MSNNNSLPSSWKTKQVTLSEIASKIPNGSHIAIGSTAATPQATVAALCDDLRLADIEISQFIPGGALPHLDEERFRVKSFFAFDRTGSIVRQGLADFMPTAPSQVPRLLQEHLYSVDVVILKMTPPEFCQAEGTLSAGYYCNLGTGVDIMQHLIRHAKLVLAEVCVNVPWTCGPARATRVSINSIHHWVQHDEPLGSPAQLLPGLNMLERAHHEDLYERMGKHLIKLVPNGATLKLGLSPYTCSVLRYLHERQDIGIHCDMIDDRVVRLIQAGVINNSKKPAPFTNKSIVNHAVGTQTLYDYCNRNPAIEFHLMDEMNSPAVLSSIPNLISIVDGTMVDLSGQVAVDSIGFKFVSGVGSTSEALRGATLSPGGKAIVVLPSRSIKRGYSNIVFAFPQGTGVTVTRSDVEYVVTEYGTAYLFGKTIRQRCLALIDIAHPSVRQELLAQAKAQFYVQSFQPGHSFVSRYPEEWECQYTTKQGTQVLVRPVKAVDEELLRDFFHKLSDQSIYMRYFRKLRSLPQRILKKTADVDYSTSMTLVALYPPPGAVTGGAQVIAIGEWVATSVHHGHNGGIPEIAFQVRDDWKFHGLGKFLFFKLVQMAPSFGVYQLKADVLMENQAMNKLCEHSGIPYVRTSDFGVYTYKFDLSKQGEATTQKQTKEEAKVSTNGSIAFA